MLSYHTKNAIYKEEATLIKLHQNLNVCSLKDTTKVPIIS
jgi:hypothetical protein